MPRHGCCFGSLVVISQSLGDISQALLLTDWQDKSEVYRELGSIDAQARTMTVRGVRVADGGLIRPR